MFVLFRFVFPETMANFKELESICPVHNVWFNFEKKVCSVGMEIIGLLNL